MKRPGTQRWIGALLVIVALVATACSTAEEPAETPESLTLLTHDSFALSEGTLASFTESTGIEVEWLTGGDAGTMLNQAILTKDNPIADVIFGIDNTFISRAIDNDLLLAHEAADIDTVEASLRLDGDHATPITYGDVCINYDIEGMAGLGVAIPTNIDQLTNPEYAGLLVVEDPATSSPGLAFLMATIATFPEGTDYDWHDYWTDLFANDVAVASDWSEAYYTNFTRAGGNQPLVVSYASSPPVEVLFGETESAPTGSMTDGCFRQVEYAAVLNGTDYPQAAGELVDFLLSQEVQEDIPLNMFVYPTNTEATLPEVFVEYTVYPESPILIDASTIDENRDSWIQEWTSIARG